MPNDNTHTLPPCPFCGADPDGFGQALAKDGKSLTQSVRHPDNGCCLSILVFRIEDWNTRTPAEPKAVDDVPKFLRVLRGEPKAGDWEKEMEIHTAVEIHDRFQDDGIGDTEYVRLDEARALSSAAPRITGDSDKSDLPIANSVQLSEEMVGRLQRYDYKRNTHEQWIGRDDEGRFVAFEDVLALLRQQGPQRSEDQQGAERKWISVDERLPETGELVWGILSDFKPGDHPSHVEYERASNTWTFYGDDDWYGISVTHWCPHIADVPPPFTPTSHQVTSEATQTEE